jgi:hypothetical protein
MTSSARAARRAAAAVLSLVAVLAAGCGTSGSPSAAPTVTKTATAPAGGSSAGPSAGASSAPVTSASTAPVPAGPSPCPTRSLSVHPGIAQGTAGSVYQVLVFTNISGTTCTLYGYPGVSFGSTGTSGGQIGAAAAENPATPRRLVTLAPQGTGNVQLQIVDAGNFPASRCHPVTAHWLVVYPPNQTTPVYVHYSSQACAKPVRVLTVSVVLPGSGG